MSKVLACFGLLIVLGLPVFADDSPPSLSPQIQTQKPVESATTGNPFADPFFAPPSRINADLGHPSSGTSLDENLVPRSVPFRSEKIWFATDFYFAASQGTLLPRPSGQRELSQLRPGLRANGGLWLTEDARFGLDATFLYLGDASVSRTNPDQFSVRAHSAVIGGDINFRYGWTTSERGRLDWLLGYRYMNLRDTVDLNSAHSRTLNQFHGAQVGLGGTHRLFDRLTLTTKATVAMGVDISDVNVNGGNDRENLFSVLPEGTAKLGWDFTDRFRVNGGYSFLYWSRVRRAADQLDATSRPAYGRDQTDFWIQGWTVGLDLRY
jgi:Putative beta barrel porin-7 (BBP7)